MTLSRTDDGLRRISGALLAGGALTFAGAATVLSSTFDWPDLLRKPAEVVLPADLRRLRRDHLLRALRTAPAPSPARPPRIEPGFRTDAGAGDGMTTTARHVIFGTGAIADSVWPAGTSGQSRQSDFDLHRPTC
jgi:hypothetical protein